MYSKTLLVFLILHLSSSLSYGQRDRKFFRNDYTYIDAVESFYKIHTTPGTWADANRVCALEGASFWHPENDNEANVVISFWNTSQPNIAWVFSAMSDLLTDGLFETIDGKSVSEVYNRWSPGQPDKNQGREHCTCLNFGALHDCWCQQRERFICKKSLQSLQWNYCCNMFNLDYNFSKDIGKCYKLHTTPLNWNDAHAVCHAEQSHLAVVNNQLEADYLANLAASASNQRVEGNYFRGIYHLGFHHKLNGGWQTVKGTSMNVDSEMWWGNYQPEGRGQCGSMFFNGRLNNINCDTKSFFICEHEVESSSWSLETSQQ